MKTDNRVAVNHTHLGISARRFWRRTFLELALTLGWAGLVPLSHGVFPPPGGAYANGNTALSVDALFDLTTGVSNTGIGEQALYYLTQGSGNTAVGQSSLFAGTTSMENTAIGVGALANTITGYNTALGFSTLESNASGYSNTSVGSHGLLYSTAASGNTASGDGALSGNSTGIQSTAYGHGAGGGTNNTGTGFAVFSYNGDGDHDGINNTADGLEALLYNYAGSQDTASGEEALFSNTTGSNNLADGASALLNSTTGTGNISVGYSAGINLTIGSNNIAVGNAGVPGESGNIRIGSSGTQTATFVAGVRGVVVTGGQAVLVNSSDQFGVKASSARFKEAIQPMGDRSEAILALRPVSFRYKKALDPKVEPEFGLIAEEVAKVDRDLIVTDENGKPFSVRYEEVNAMLLNEFLKEHREVELQQTKIAERQAEIVALQAGVKAQAAQIKKVSEQVTSDPSRTRLAANGK